MAATDDRVLRGELASHRGAERHREASESVPPSMTTSELLSRLRESAAFVAQAAQALTLELKDERSWRGYHSLCRRAFEGELDPSALVHAYGKALGPQVRNAGAIFTLEASRRRPPMRS